MLVVIDAHPILGSIIRPEHSSKAIYNTNQIKGIITCARCSFAKAKCMDLLNAINLSKGFSGIS